MRIVLHDRKTDDVTEYNASALTVSDGYIILATNDWHGSFPISRFDFVGFDEK